MTLAAVAVCAVLVGKPSPARANSESLVEVILLVAAVDVGIMLGGLVVGGVNSHYGVSEKPAPLGWRIAGYTFGGLNAAMGVTVLVASDGEPGMVTVGILQLVLAGLDIGTAVYAGSPTGPEAARVSFTPLAMLDSEGQPAFGAGLRVTGW